MEDKPYGFVHKIVHKFSLTGNEDFKTQKKYLTKKYGQNIKVALVIPRNYYRIKWQTAWTKHSHPSGVTFLATG